MLQRKLCDIFSFVSHHFFPWFLRAVVAGCLVDTHLDNTEHVLLDADMCGNDVRVALSGSAVRPPAAESTTSTPHTKLRFRASKESCSRRAVLSKSSTTVEIVTSAWHHVPQTTYTFTVPHNAGSARRPCSKANATEVDATLNAMLKICHWRRNYTDDADFRRGRPTNTICQNQGYMYTHKNTSTLSMVDTA